MSKPPIPISCCIRRVSSSTSSSESKQNLYFSIDQILGSIYLKLQQSNLVLETSVLPFDVVGRHLRSVDHNYVHCFDRQKYGLICKKQKLWLIVTQETWTSAAKWLHV